MKIVMHDEQSLGLGCKVVSPNAGMVLRLFEKENVMYGDYAQPPDTITALPGQVTTIRATFDKPGRYVWHCHVLAHTDHQMMRVFHVGDQMVNFQKECRMVTTIAPLQSGNCRSR
jgi:FtsP/CotA-like multicopper oxidase with cupredoxin domain